MASTMIPIQACATRSSHRVPDPDRRKNSSPNWWTPLFGWSSEPDYIDSDNKAPNPASKPSKLRFAGGLTEEKAKQLRMMTVGTETFHDTMYHSAIASRLASDFKARSDE
ncbi:hypothetical protein TSUD_207720 [Trifolium subterraneum]|uniref:Uncharacterized protein n=1 Tax=Trifolium subterraneum TaxID=3900 RepID=A0A2Z6MTY9_TRISU|nr:hypothetical protein TSUD_207720 [Trifolium subterraneum]